jgi:acetylornithine deacetylase
MDTVGVAGMVVPPFEGVVRVGRLVGRGACDMKAGVAGLLSASAALAAAGHPGELVVALTMDEEHASLGMQALVASGVRADAAVVCEPTGLAVMPAHKGFVWADLEVRGRAAHGSRPEVGIDAIRHAARFLIELDALEAELRSRPAHPLLGHGSLHAGTIEGGVAPSVYPDRCHLVIERRTLPGETPAKVRRELEAALGRARSAVQRLDARLTVGLSRPGTEVAHDHALVVGLLDAAHTCGRESGVEGMTAWVDAAYLNEAGVPAVCFGPGSIEQAHSADEWIDTSEIPDCAEILETFARRFLEGR